MTDAGAALLREVQSQLETVNFVNFALEETSSRSWASATFTGMRHRLSLRVAGEDAEARADAFLSGLEEREFALPGHIVADIALVSRRSAAAVVRLELEALTIEDG